RVVLAGTSDDFNGIGDGFGFPLRFRVEASNDPAFASGVATIAACDREDFANPGITPVEFDAAVEARYVRVTATRLAPRQNDFIFALAELEVIDRSGTNAAAGAAVSASGSIEAPVRWAAKNL